MVPVKDFAKALLWEAHQNGITIDNLKLQKLAYYCQGYHLSIYGVPVFNNEIKAWRFGPVSPELYFEYKNYGSNDIAFEAFFCGDKILSSLNSSVKSVITLVLDLVGGYSPNQLVNKTHRESPWKNHVDGDSVDNKTITHDELKTFFDEEVSKLQGNMIAEILDALEDCQKSGSIAAPKRAYESDDNMLEWIKSL